MQSNSEFACVFIIFPFRTAKRSLNERNIVLHLMYLYHMATGCVNNIEWCVLGLVTLNKAKAKIK
jgi:hypothetical protein